MLTNRFSKAFTLAVQARAAQTIGEQFGEKVLRIVDACTDGIIAKEMSGMAAEIERLANHSQYANEASY
jgi:hypothetical protein